MQNVPVGKDFKSVQNYKKKCFLNVPVGKDFKSVLVCQNYPLHITKAFLFSAQDKFFTTLVAHFHLQSEKGSQVYQNNLTN